VAKVRVAVLGTVGKAVFLDPDATNGATIGLNLRLPNGYVPSLEELAEIICSYCTPVQSTTNIWNTIYNIPENIVQIGGLDCCDSIPIRRCTVDTPATEECTYTPVEPAELFQAPVYDELTSGERTGSGLYEDLDGILWQQGLESGSTSSTAVIFNESGVNHYKMFLRSIDPATETELTNEEFLYPTDENRAGTHYVFPVHNSKKTQLVFHASSPSYWYWSVDGVASAEIQPSELIDPSDTAYYFRGHTSGFAKHHNPNVGVYNFSGRAASPLRKGIVRYASNGIDEMPGATPLNAAIINDTSIAAGSARILGFDSEDRLYVEADGELLCYTPDLVEVWRHPVPTDETFGTLTPYAVFSDGAVLAARSSSPPSNTQTRWYDISDPENWVYISSTANNTLSIGLLIAYNQCEGMYTASAQGLTACTVDCVEIPASEANITWECLDPGPLDMVECGFPVKVCDDSGILGDYWKFVDLSAAGGETSRVEITNADASEDGGPIFDLRPVEQAEGGTLQVMTVDAWGRVVESRAATVDDLPSSGPLQVRPMHIMAVNEPNAGDVLTYYTAELFRWADPSEFGGGGGGEGGSGLNMLEGGELNMLPFPTE
jgi:hypothetical protein